MRKSEKFSKGGGFEKHKKKIFLKEIWSVSHVLEFKKKKGEQDPTHLFDFGLSLLL